MKKCLVNGELPPIIMVSSDNDHKFAPSNRKGQVRMAFLWEIFNLDVLIHSSYAPNCSKYNRVEREMAQLSKVLIGHVDLDRKPFGEDKKAKQKNANAVLEKLKEIFLRAGPKYFVNSASVYQTERTPLLEHWPTFEEIDLFLEGKNQDDEKIKSLLKKIHTHSEQGNGLNLFVLRKCDDPTCCSPKRASKYWEITSSFGGFIPSPLIDPTRSNEKNEHFYSYEDRNKISGVQMDVDFPSLKGNAATCGKCNRRIHSEIDRKIHENICHPTRTDLLLDADISLEDKISSPVPTGTKGRSLAKHYSNLVEQAKQNALIEVEREQQLIQNLNNPQPLIRRKNKKK
ncbi:predicted protein [Naegleria gruberi]|uniref:Predicted protein n=1 Tax=Naegleria gruberi TaxID=5762 RepID=D2W603_NAEGR|nr:uncharacterized protein NAEGRDRAFT_54882 [Naegleria gruberi]EFC35497.1 predicted protein [Naegleria gruberi]|eukprot:XP_002668241.1 predicted protein [Naegleria gruberi strain NEG-M]